MCITESDETRIEAETCVCESTTEKCRENEVIVCSTELDETGTGIEKCTCKASEGCSEEEKICTTIEDQEGIEKEEC